MNIAKRIVSYLTKSKTPLSIDNVEAMLRKAAGTKFRAAIIHLIRKELRTQLENHSKDQLIEMLVDSYGWNNTCEDSNNSLIEHYYNDFIRTDIESVSDFVEYLDKSLTKPVLQVLDDDHDSGD